MRPRTATWPAYAVLPRALDPNFSAIGWRETPPPADLQGREAVRDFLKTNGALAKEIEGRVREAAGVFNRQGEKPFDGKESRSEEKGAETKRPIPETTRRDVARSLGK